MKRVVLLGAGHAHLEVLRALARQPMAGCEVHLVTPYPRQIYTGMLPGWIAGRYGLDQCAIALDAITRRAGVTLHEAAVRDIDLGAGLVHCAGGQSLRFDKLSIDTGPMPALDAVPGAADHALAIRPIEHFVAAWPAVVDRISRQGRRFDLAVLGAGAGGLELAFAMRHRAVREGWPQLQVALVGLHELPLDGAPQSARRRAVELLGQRAIGWHGGRRAVAVKAGGIHFADGPPIAFDGCVVVTGAAAPAWAAASGLATDENGFIRVSATLQSESHRNVFAVGDIAAQPPPVTKSGVYAVRAGQALAQNLRLACASGVLKPWIAQRRALYLISTGDQNALAIWGAWTWDGRWVWRLKDAIDRRYVRGLSNS